MLGFEYNAEDEKRALIELGIEQGIEKKQFEVVKNLFKMKMSVDDIALAVNSSKEKVLQIIREISK